MATAGAEGLSQHAPTLAACLMRELPGRLWEGKAAVLDALAQLCKACPQAFGDESSPLGSGSGSGHVRAEEIVKALYAAAGRQNLAFKKAALTALETALLALKMDFYGSVSPLLLDGCRGAKEYHSSEQSAAKKVSWVCLHRYGRKHFGTCHLTDHVDLLSSTPAVPQVSHKAAQCCQCRNSHSLAALKSGLCFISGDGCSFWHINGAILVQQ